MVKITHVSGVPAVSCIHSFFIRILLFGPRLDILIFLVNFRLQIFLQIFLRVEPFYSGLCYSSVALFPLFKEGMHVI